MRLPPTSVRTRLTLWYTLALTGPLVVFAIASYLLFSGTLRARTDAFLEDALSVFASELLAERRHIPTLDEAVRTTVAEVRFRDLDIVVLDEAGSVVAVSPVVARPAADSPTAPYDAASLLAGVDISPASLPRIAQVDRSQGAFRLLVRSLPTGEGTLRVAGVYPLREVDVTLRRIRRLFLIAIPLLIAVAGAGGSFLAGRSLRPVAAMAARAAEIGASTLHERLPVAAEDELGDLAKVLNDLLDRLERSFEQQRRFMADASHELRTPTSIVRTEADVTLSREDRSEDEYRSSMANVQDAARRLTRIVDDIFLLARADAGHLLVHPGPLYLEDLVSDTVRAVAPIARKRGVTVEMSADVEAQLHGDGDLLGRLILNLLDNAIKYSPEGGAVRVTLTQADDAWELSVTDEGPGIPPEAREQVFERFFRLDRARSREETTLTSGAGLGLPICRRIAEVHGGEIYLADSRRGRTEFRLRLPRLDAAPLPD